MYVLMVGVLVEICEGVAVAVRVLVGVNVCATVAVGGISVGRTFVSETSIGTNRVGGTSLGRIWVGATSVGGIGDIQIAVPISARPVKLETTLGRKEIWGTSISFAFTPPPNRPTRRAAQPAIVRTMGKVMIFSFLVQKI
jgi:hypothetical protein